MRYLIFKRSLNDKSDGMGYCTHIHVIDDNDKIVATYVDDWCHQRHRKYDEDLCKTCSFESHEISDFRCHKHEYDRLNKNLTYQELTKEEFEQLIFPGAL